MNLLEVINENAVAVNVKAQNKEEVFECVCDLLLKDGSITSKEEFKQDLYIRESQGKTGIGDGIAIPHGKSLAVKRNCISVLKLEQPIQWETLDGLPAQVFIIFAINQKDKDDYFLRLMASVAKKLAQEGTCGKLMGSSTKEDILEAFCWGDHTTKNEEEIKDEDSRGYGMYCGYCAYIHCQGKAGAGSTEAGIYMQNRDPGEHRNRGAADTGGNPGGRCGHPGH